MSRSVNLGIFLCKKKCESFKNANCNIIMDNKKRGKNANCNTKSGGKINYEIIT